MNILFVCSRNKWRSRTAESIFKNHQTHSVKSAGTEKSARIRINQKMIDWADVIFVMEKKHRERITTNFTLDRSDKDPVILDIPDVYQYMDEELIELLKESVQGYF